MSYAEDYMQEEKGGYYGDGDSFSHRKRSVSFTGDELLAKRIKSSTGIIHPKPAEDDDEALHPYGAPGNQHTSSDQAGVIIADKRTDPIVYQSAIVNMARIIRPQDMFKQRKLNWDTAKDKMKDLVAPLGTVDCYVIQIADLVWSDRGYEAETFRGTDVNGAFVPVWSCVNAKYTHEDMVFQGAAIFNQDGNPRTAFNSDEVGTLQVRGTITTNHYGSEVIQVGDLVYGSIFPWSYTDAHGNLMPKINTIGTQGAWNEKDENTGVSEGRFMPQLWGLSQYDHAGYFAGLDIEVEDLVEDSNILDGIINSKSTLDALETLQYKAKHQIFAKAAIDLPSREYVNAAIADYIWSIFREEQNARHIGDGIFRWIQRMYQKTRNDSSKYQDNLGANSVAFNHPSLNPLIASKFAAASTWTNGLREIDRMTAASALSRWTGSLMRMAMTRQQAFLDSHVVGKSMHAVEPGASFDVDLGSR